MSARKAVIAQVLVYSLALLPIVAGCGESPPVDTSLLSGEPCEPPCWQGLVPGVSTEHDVVEFLNTSKLVDGGTVFRGDLTSGTGETVGFTLQWLSTASMQGSRAHNSSYLEGGVLQVLEVHPDVEITLEDLLEVYAAPQRYVAGVSGLHFMDFAVILYYREHGFLVRLSLPLDDRWLRPESVIQTVWYFRPAEWDEFLAGDYYRILPVPYMDEEAELREWRGYGPVEAE